VYKKVILVTKAFQEQEGRAAALAAELQQATAQSAQIQAAARDEIEAALRRGEALTASLAERTHTLETTEAELARVKLAAERKQTEQAARLAELERAHGLLQRQHGALELKADELQTANTQHVTNEQRLQQRVEALEEELRQAGDREAGLTDSGARQSAQLQQFATLTRAIHRLTKPFVPDPAEPAQTTAGGVLIDLLASPPSSSAPARPSRSHRQSAATSGSGPAALAPTPGDADPSGQAFPSQLSPVLSASSLRNNDSYIPGARGEVVSFAEPDATPTPRTSHRHTDSQSSQFSLQRSQVQRGDIAGTRSLSPARLARGPAPGQSQTEALSASLAHSLAMLRAS
jgi:hypothetical protein